MSNDPFSDFDSMFEAIDVIDTIISTKNFDPLRNGDAIEFSSVADHKKARLVELLLESKEFDLLLNLYSKELNQGTFDFNQMVATSGQTLRDELFNNYMRDSNNNEHMRNAEIINMPAWRAIFIMQIARIGWGLDLAEMDGDDERYESINIVRRLFSQPFYDEFTLGQIKAYLLVKIADAIENNNQNLLDIILDLKSENLFDTQTSKSNLQADQYFLSADDLEKNDYLLLRMAMQKSEMVYDKMISHLRPRMPADWDTHEYSQLIQHEINRKQKEATAERNRENEIYEYGLTKPQAVRFFSAYKKNNIEEGAKLVKNNKLKKQDFNLVKDQVDKIVKSHKTNSRHKKKSDTSDKLQSFFNNCINYGLNDSQLNVSNKNRNPGSRSG